MSIKINENSIEFNGFTLTFTSEGFEFDGEIIVNSISLPQTFSATPAANSVNEGSSLTINVATTGVNNGTTLYYTVSEPGDFDTSSGSFVINNGSGSFTVTPSEDQTTEGSETFTVSIRTDSISGTIVDTTSTITINDTSTAPSLLLSRNLTGTQGFTMNTLVPNKDMGTATQAQSIPVNYNPSGGNLTPSGTRYVWVDWSGDIFDNWGDFYIYNPATGSASYIQFNSINGGDGVVYTETQTHHSKSFTIKHGWVAQGIFKLDVQCSDDTFDFSIGMYGNMGSDGSTVNVDRQYVASWGNLSYNYNSQSGTREYFFTHFIPKVKSFNDGITLSSNNFTANLNTAISGSDNLAIWSDTLQVGATMYFVKGSNNTTGAMYDWVANDIEAA